MAFEWQLVYGYTLLDKNNHQPAGFGLSYTEFNYANPQVRQQDGNVEISVTVSNTGSRDGEEIIQVYAGMERSKIERQQKLLKGFEKIVIPAGGTVDVAISIPLDELRYYDI